MFDILLAGLGLAALGFLFGGKRGAQWLVGIALVLTVVALGVALLVGLERNQESSNKEDEQRHAQYVCEQLHKTEIENGTYTCNYQSPNGEWGMVWVPRSPDNVKPHVTPIKHIPVLAHATVHTDTMLSARCAFDVDNLPCLPAWQKGQIKTQDGSIAWLNAGDRIDVLSPLTRAENGFSIYKVRTSQGWVGWVTALDIDIDK